MSHKIGYSITPEDGVKVEFTEDYTGGLTLLLDETIPVNQTNKIIGATLDVSEVKSFVLVASAACLLEPNDGTTPDDPITLVANKPYVWTEDSYDAFFFGTDWTALYITNTPEVRLRIWGKIDPTPA
jgi:hypothetical protein